MDLLQTIKSSFVRTIGTAYPSKRYLLAISGGVDSRVLFETLTTLIPNQNLGVAHYNHSQRGLDSLRDESFVRKLTRSMAVPFFLGRGDSSLKSEAALRTERHNFFSQCLNHNDYDFLVTGHHADDQLETFFMRLIRGTGLSGLKCMAPKDGNIFRPLLNIPKANIIAFARSERLSFREDRTNLSSRFFRNRVRQKLIPCIFNITDNFGNPTHLYRRTTELIEELQWVDKQIQLKTAKLYDRYIIETPYWFRIGVGSFSKIKPRWKFLLLRQIFKKLGVSHLSRQQWAKLCKSVLRDRRYSAPGKIRITRSYGYLYFQNEQQINQPHPTFRCQGRFIASSELGFKLELARIEDPKLQCRSFRPGDRIAGKKVRDYFRKVRVPLPERCLVPLLVESESKRVVWIFSQQKEGISVQRSSFPYAHLT